MSGFLKIYYIILIYSVYGKLFFNLPAITADVLAIGFIFLSAYHDNYKLRVGRKEGNYFFAAIIIPAAVMLIYSLFMQVVVYSFSSDYLVRTVTLCVRLVLYSLLGMRTVHVFGEKSVNLLLTSCIIVYIPTIIEFFMHYGLISGVIYLFTSNAYNESVVLEVHRLTYIFGFITVYFFYQKIVNGRRVMKYAITSLIFTILGLKRITYFALIISIALMFAVKFLKEKKAYKLLCISSVVMVIVALGYVDLIKSGLLEKIFGFLGIQDSFRFNFWEYFSPKYELGPGFLGYGLSYSQRQMWHEWSNIKDLASVTNLHNDILGYYLGLGFLGFIMFWAMYFYGQVKLLKKWFSVNSAAFAFILSVFYFIIMATSNEGLPGFIYGLYAGVIFAAVAADKKTREKEEEQQQAEGI